MASALPDGAELWIVNAPAVVLADNETSAEVTSIIPAPA